MEVRSCSVSTIGRCDCYTTLAYLSNIVPSDGFQAARADATRAVGLDYSLADAHASLAYIHLYYDWDWAGAEREFHRALALNPNDATAHEWYAVFLTAMMRPGEARAQIERAQALDPLSAAIATDAGFELYYTRQYDPAVTQLAGVIERYPHSPLAHLWCGSSSIRGGGTSPTIRGSIRSCSAWECPEVVTDALTRSSPARSRRESPD
jgi:tetratricopeptide (TPR) repeat protein